MNLTRHEFNDDQRGLDIRGWIQSARQRVAVAVNAELTLLHWEICFQINKDVLAGERAEYGKQVLANLAKELAAEFGAGWGVKHLRNCVQLAEVFPDREIVYALRSQLSWTHLRNLIYIPEPLKREFYIEIAKVEHQAT
jgi:hypothetical protein